MPKAALVVRDLTKYFEREGRQSADSDVERRITAVDHINFEIGMGELFGLLGPNGAGKTTTIKMLSTLLLPDAGDAVVVRQDNLLALVLWPAFIFLGGFAFPVQSLPSFLQPISWALPITYGLDMTRRAVLLGEGFGSLSVSNDLVALLISIAVLVPIGYLLFDRLMRRGLRKGTLSA